MTQILGPRDVNELQAKAIQLIGLIYDSTFEPERWNDFLKAYAELYPGALQWLWLEDRERADVRVVTGMNSDKSYLPSYEDHYCNTNPWTNSMLGLPEGQTYLGDWLASPEDLLTSEFYNDWLKPQDLGKGFGATILKAGRHCMFYTVVHSERASTGLADLELLKLLVPHMQRAVRLHGRMLTLEQRAANTEELVNQLDIGLVLLDADGRVQVMNREAERIFALDDGLRVWQRHLYVSAPSEQAKLARIISEVIALSKGNHVTTRGALAIERPSGKRSFGIIVAPQIGETEKSPLSVMSPVARACVYISDPEKRRQPAINLLGELFGLTPAQAKLAANLASGSSLTEACEVLSITRETGRSQLKVIFEKTDTHRQGELIQLLLTSGGGLSLVTGYDA